MKIRLAQWRVHPVPEDMPLRESCLLPEALVGSLPADDWVWTLSDTELWGQSGESHAFLMDRDDDGAPISTERLLTALTDGYGIQLTWGDLRAFEPGSTDPVITIAGFDSTWYDIDGRDDLVRLIEERFTALRWSDEHVRRIRGTSGSDEPPAEINA
jgi:hypothetical protein